MTLFSMDLAINTDLARQILVSFLHDEVLRTDAAAEFAPDALYGYGWTQLELKRPEPAITS